MPLELNKVKNLIEHWEKGAIQDFETAISIFKLARRNAASLFYLHLAFEKLLKAKVVERTSDHAPYTHNLVVLIEKAQLDIDTLDMTFFSDVNGFNMSGRYPSEKFSLQEKATTEFTQNYFQIAREQWLLISKNSAPNV
jgi:HEPN domain-containing protein